MTHFFTAFQPDFFMAQDQLYQQQQGTTAAMTAQQFMMMGNNSTWVEMLSCNPTLNYVNQAKVHTGWYIFDICAASLSSVSLLFVACLILFDPRLQMHPNRLIAYICICDAFCFNQFVMRYLICGHGWNNFLN
jgi:hypothetical protein